MIFSPRAAFATLAVLLALRATAVGAQSGDGVFGSPSHFTEPTGAGIFRSVCAGCHMASGQGATGAGSYPSLTRAKNLATPGYAVGIVLRGQGAMPPFARTLSDQQIADVIDYIRRNFGNSFNDDVSAADVKAAR
jgi:mono/diheme cytochrome c family protein